MVVAGIIILVLVLLYFAAAYFAYFAAFGRNPKREAGCYDMLEGEQYKKYIPQLRSNVDDVLGAKWEDVYITSRDGVKLYGRYFHHRDGAPLMILFHGYRSNAIRDVNGAHRVCRRNGLNVLTVDQRAHGKSGGKTITFGLKERYDCIDWANYAIDRFGKDTRITIMGVSMGASTVLMAAGTDGLPENVKGVAADCGYSDIREVVAGVINRMKLPQGPAWHFVKAGARIFGRFDLEEVLTLDLVKKIKIPVMLVHGEKDSIIPVRMSKEMYEACTSEKELILVPEADHGMSYFVDNETYEKAMTEFFLQASK